MSKAVDLTGKQFGYWKVLYRDYEYENMKTLQGRGGARYYKCKCICGKEKDIKASNLTNEKTKSCGCQSPQRQYIDLTGQIFGELIVICKDEEKELKNFSPNYQHKTFWKCRCSCGNITSVASQALRDGRTQSCGCKSNISRGENKIISLLNQNNIPYVREKRFNTCINPETCVQLRFDFYINNDFLLEYDGRQHYCSENHGWNNEENHIKTEQRDAIKNQWCKNNHIPLKRIPYTDIENFTFEDIMSDKYLI